MCIDFCKKRSAVSLLAGNRDVPVLEQENLLCHGKPDADTAKGSVVSLIETVEDIGKLLLFDSFPVVTDDKICRKIVLFQGSRNGSSAGSMFQAVLHDV